MPLTLDTFNDYNVLNVFKVLHCFSISWPPDFHEMLMTASYESDGWCTHNSQVIDSPLYSWVWRSILSKIQFHWILRFSSNININRNLRASSSIIKTEPEMFESLEGSILRVEVIKADSVWNGTKTRLLQNEVHSILSDKTSIIRGSY